ILKQEKDKLAERHNKQVPLLLKITPDLSQTEAITILNTVLSVGFDGVIATNTTQSRIDIKGLPFAEEEGGLSGPPVANASKQLLTWIREKTDTLPFIAVGGINSVENAMQRFNAGANLIQLYTGLIYDGPVLLRNIIKSLARKKRESL